MPQISLFVLPHKSIISQTSSILKFQLCGVLAATRTRDLLLRRQLLYPAELPGHNAYFTSNYYLY